MDVEEAEVEEVELELVFVDVVSVALPDSALAFSSRFADGWDCSCEDEASLEGFSVFSVVDFSVDVAALELSFWNQVKGFQASRLEPTALKFGVVGSGAGFLD